MNSIWFFTVVFTIALIWLLLASYHYAYNRKWGNENSAVDKLPNTNDNNNDHQANNSHTTANQ